jgi:hypothetical protein
MTTDTELHAGDPCPIDGGTMVPDHAQDPETQIANKHLNSPNPAAAQRYERQVRAKVEAGGVIHKCTTCGYRARFKTAEAEKDARAADETARADREQARDERDAKAREDRDRPLSDREEREAKAGGAASTASETSGRRARGAGASGNV